MAMTGNRGADAVAYGKTDAEDDGNDQQGKHVHRTYLSVGNAFASLQAIPRARMRNR
jgi:hypothetical protein